MYVGMEVVDEVGWLFVWWVEDAICDIGDEYPRNVR
jgi:hypothetical protein